MAKRIARIDDLTPDVRNANKGTERGRYMIEQSLREVGAGRSIVTDKEGRVIAGNKTLECAEELGLPIRTVVTNGSELVVVQREDLDLESDEKARKLAYYDNRSSEVGLEWDAQQISADLEDGLDLSDMFKDDEISALLESAADELLTENSEPPEPQEDKAEQLREQWQTERGQLWEIPSKTVNGKCHRLLCGDSTNENDVGRLMGDDDVSAVVTDTPYGMNINGIENDSPKDLRKLFDGVLISTPLRDAIIVNFQGARLFWVWMDAIRDVNHKIERALWMYKPNDGTFPWRGWLQTGQMIIISSIGDPRWGNGGQYRHDTYVLNYVGDALEKLHPTPKPVGVVSHIIQWVTMREETVLDWFLGSGTTMVAAEQSGRLCCGMELKPQYVAVTLQRLADMGLEPRLVGTED